VIAPGSKIIIPPDVLFHELEGEAVLLNVENGKYYGLDEVGTRVWRLLTEGNSLPAVVRILVQEYDVDSDRLAADLQALVAELAGQGLLKIETSPWMDEK
jgi:hypothetical protein